MSDLVLLLFAQFEQTESEASQLCAIVIWLVNISDHLYLLMWHGAAHVFAQTQIFIVVQMCKQ